MRVVEISKYINGKIDVYVLGRTCILGLTLNWKEFEELRSKVAEKGRSLLGCEIPHKVLKGYMY